ncbi:hypothetical protein AUK40_05420 [Candidatus Wirthbacteria bacterium CG2_30_54_11]|uniref:Glutaconate CoA-transferase n=1 Tax=Candidatus Wirthbacteria bacterium CG2_30_54_11 TaxID=1817892 RepID=A0A1J5IS50_9BACT|nr:MAG: hypothetical protein AUK40_05420 [Candidatus Wirthbacteria bacterium CG2_30_54_11]
MVKKTDTKIISIKKAVSWIKDGMTVALGEFSYQNLPMEVVREIIRTRKKDLTIISGPTSGLATDMLISAGCVSRVVTAGVGFEDVAGIAPGFRSACERGTLEVWECDECMWQAGLEAAARGQPFALWQGGIGSDIPSLNPSIHLVVVSPAGEVKRVRSLGNAARRAKATGGQIFLQIPPIVPDITFIHAATADELGFVQYPQKRYLGRVFNEKLLSEATRGPVIATVEKIVSHEQIMKHPELTVIRNAWVAQAPRGAWPGGCNGVYPPDLKAYRAYVRSGGDVHLFLGEGTV